MGNQQAQLAGSQSVPTGAAPPGSSDPSAASSRMVVRANAHAHAGEPLESYLREKQRDEHLKNLGFKRSKSLRKSISKRLKRKSHHKQKVPPASDEVDQVAAGDAGDASRRGSAVPAVSEPPATAKTKKQPDRVSSSASTSTSVERIDRAEYPEPKKRLRPRVGQPEPMPTHIQDLSEERPRRMDRLRRSLRSSLRRKRDHRGGSGGNGGSSGGGTTGGEGGKPQLWAQDEVAVRSGTCSFMVKYLGCVEVFESRGMQVCEEAVRVLKTSKRKSVRAILYVHGDGLRVVDEETKGLIVDQTIEKVSFCAPDRNYERGFSYICRDGTTRRWMCHGFMAVRESGERLSHAVGCAFAICLEKKQQRDKLCNVSMTFDQASSSFTRHGSFRQATLTERLQDPQVLKPSTETPPLEKVENPFAVARPHATDLMIQRQTSFRGFNQLQSSQSPFKRQLSLRLNELPSTLERQRSDSGLTPTSAAEDLQGITAVGTGELVETAPNTMTAGANQGFANPFQSAKFDKFGTIQEDEGEEDALPPPAAPSQAPFVSSSAVPAPAPATTNQKPATTAPAAQEDSISSMCQQLSQELSMLSNQETQLKKNLYNNHSSNSSVSSSSFNSNNKNSNNNPVPSNDRQESQSMPYIPITTPSPSLQPVPVPAPTQENGDNRNRHGSSSSGKKDPLANVKPIRYDNPWDFVPDQPKSIALTITTTTTTPPAAANTMKSASSPLQQPVANCDSSSGVSSISGTSNGVAKNSEGDWFNGGISDKTTLSNGKMADFDVALNGGGALFSNGDAAGDNFWSLPGARILDDPFDAEWAALATRNNSINVTNPFNNDEEATVSAQSNGLQTFELQM